MKPVSSGIPTEAKFQVSLLSRMVGARFLRGWGEIEIKAKAGAWAELGKNAFNSGHLRFCLQPKGSARSPLRPKRSYMYMIYDMKGEKK